jgi:hypothetical protein
MYTHVSSYVCMVLAEQKRVLGPRLLSVDNRRWVPGIKLNYVAYYYCLDILVGWSVALIYCQFSQ